MRCVSLEIVVVKMLQIKENFIIPNFTDVTFFDTLYVHKRVQADFQIPYE